MAVARIGAVHDRIGKIASHIAAIEDRNPLNRAVGPAPGVAKPAMTTNAAATANAFQQHLATQTMQAMTGTLGGPGGVNGAGGGTTNPTGLAGASVAALSQGLGARTALGVTGASALLGSTGGSAATGGAVQALAALLQAGAQVTSTQLSSGQPAALSATNGQPTGTPLPSAQALSGLPGAGAAGTQAPGAGALPRAGADPLTTGIAALPKGTHPAIPERRGSKVPAELKGFGNGKIPADQLESVGVKDHQLWSPAAKAFKLMRAAAQRDGIQIGVNSSYRDVACQQCMVDKYGLYGQGGRAAPPGKSNHGWGLSIDLQLDDAAKKWMRANAKHYGFVEDVAREPWHWTFIADGDAVQANAAALLR